MGNEKEMAKAVEEEWKFLEFAFAAAARVDLGFHDVNGAREVFRRGHCFFNRERRLPFGNRCAETL
jgi:hypothetical protein